MDEYVVRCRRIRYKSTDESFVRIRTYTLLDVDEYDVTVLTNKSLLFIRTNAIFDEKENGFKIPTI